MKMRIKIFSCLICILAASCTNSKPISTAQIPNSWRADSSSLPTDAENNTVAPTVDRMLGIGLSTLDAQATDDQKSKWRLRGFMWNIGVSTKGLLGLIFGSGAAGFETLYTRTDEVKKPASSLAATSVNTIEFTGAEKPAEIPPQFEATIRDLVAKGKLRNESHLRKELLSSTEHFREMISAVKTMPDCFNNFYLHGFQLEVYFDVEGNIVGPIGVGIAVEFRLNWIRENASTTIASTDAPKTEFGKNMSRQLAQFAQNISYDMDALVDSAAAENIDSSGYHLIQFKPYVVVGGGGDIGIASVANEWLLMLRFNRKENSTANPSLNLVVTPGDSIPVFTNNNGSSSAFVRAPRRQFTRGLRRAMKIANFFASRARKQTSSGWKLKEFSSNFEITRGGSIGMMSIDGTPGLEITFGRNE